MSKKDLRDIFSRNLQTELRHRQYTQEEFCNRMNARYEPKIKRSSVSYWTTGKQIPRLEVVQNIADFFGKDVGYMLSDHSSQQIPRDVNTGLTGISGEQQDISSRILGLTEKQQDMVIQLLGLTDEQQSTALRLLGLSDKQLRLVNTFLDGLLINNDQ